MKEKPEAPQKSEYTNKETIQTVSEKEVINLTEVELRDTSHKVLDMNQINIAHCNLSC